MRFFKIGQGLPHTHTHKKKKKRNKHHKTPQPQKKSPQQTKTTPQKITFYKNDHIRKKQAGTPPQNKKKFLQL